MNNLTYDNLKKIWDGQNHVNVIKMRIVMNKLTKSELMRIYNEGKNLSGKPIFIDFYADW